MRLNKEQIRIRILVLALSSRSFSFGGKFCLQGGGNFLCEIGLNRKDVSQIAVVIFCPDVFVVVRVDELNVHPNAIASATDATFQSVATPSALPISRASRARSLSIGHDGRTRDDLQVADL